MQKTDIDIRGENNTAIVGKQVVSLVVGSLTNNTQKRRVQCVVSLIASRLHRLAEKLVVIKMRERNRLVNLAVACAVIEPTDSLVVDSWVVGQNTDRHGRGDKAQVPIGVYSWCIRCPVLVSREPSIYRLAEDIGHHVLELLEFLCGPTIVIAHDLSGLGELITVNARGEVEIHGAREGCQGRGPSIHDAQGCVSKLAFLGYGPPKSKHIRSGHIAVQLAIVFGVRPVVSTVYSRDWVRYVRGGGV